MAKCLCKNFGFKSDRKVNKMKEYVDIAKTFVDNLNKENPIKGDYEYSFSKTPYELLEYWYFDLKIIATKIQKNESSNFGGAPGFIVSKESKKAKVIAFWKKYELEEQQRIRKELNEILLRIKREDWTAAQIKKLTGIKTREALNIKNKYKSLDFSKEDNRLIIIKELEKLKKENDR